MTNLPIDPEHLPDIITALRADGVTYLNVGRGMVDLGRGPFVTGDPPAEWEALADFTYTLTVGTVEVDVVVADLVEDFNYHPPSGDWIAVLKRVNRNEYSSR